MITDAILGFFAGILSPLVDLLPSVPVPFSPEDIGRTVYGFLRPLDDRVPFLDPLALIVQAIVLTFPALLTFRVGVWIYTKVRG